MRRPGNIFLLAVLIGAISAALLYRYMREQQAGLEAARGAAVAAAVDVVIAADLIPIGSRIQAENVRVVRWPSDAQPEGFFQKADEVIGKTVRTSIERNSPVLSAHLVTEEASLLPLLIDEGMRGVSVKVDNVTGVSGFITPNSHVDVVASGSPDAQGQEIQSKVILQNVRVLAVGTTIENRENKPVEVPTVTLLVTPNDSEKVALATFHNPVRLALRNYRDDGIVHTSGVAMPLLFGGTLVSASSAPPEAASTRPSAPPPVHREPPVVEVVMGHQVSRQSY